MNEYWIKYRLNNGHEGLAIMPSEFKVLLWLLRHACRCSSISITVMLDL